ncbi:hypothetical protein MNBD_GAMMA09-3013 [hydrothermal vent metagenome]|uniref:DUF2304 domain-containing protein n=1 Tax=hydrothermal vent metagenome TaxID=652676 RepID=A0A3B0XVD8_9ZZZZ
MIALFIFLIFFIILLILVRQRLLNIDLSFPWFLSLIVLTYFSSSDDFIIGVAELLDIKSPPMVVVLLTLFVFLGLITVLSIYVTELRRRQVYIIRKLVLDELMKKPSK